jgi:hypothetical protein
MTQQPTTRTDKDELLTAELLDAAEKSKASITVNVGLHIQVTAAKIRKAMLENPSSYALCDVIWESATGKILAVTIKKEA